MKTTLLESVIAQLEKTNEKLEDIAKVTGVGRSTVYRMVNREVDPRYSHVHALARYFRLAQT